MAYSKTELKSNGNKWSPCFKSFSMGNTSDKCLPTFINLTCFMEIPNSMRIIHITSLLTELALSLYKDDAIASLYSLLASVYAYFSSSIWWMQNIWSEVDLKHLLVTNFSTRNTVPTQTAIIVSPSKQLWLSLTSNVWYLGLKLPNSPQSENARHLLRVPLSYI